MGNEHRAASAEIVFGLRTFGANPLPVRVELEYDSDDPYAVVAAFHSGRGTVRWMFSRDLLADGLLAPSGDGDVRISPGADASKVVFELEAPDGAAVLEAPAHEIAAFLDRSYEQVPGGDEPEWFDFEAEIAKLAFRS